MNLPIPESVKVWSQFGHPVIMWVLFALTLYAMYLGIQVRRTRSAEGEEKKQLIQGKFNLKHYQVGSLILALMVLGSIGGMTVTYINNGKLFVAPHLVVGLGMTGLIATSAALSPFMQKGQDWARYTHIALNTAIVGLFGWQAVTGVDIVLRIISKM
jgi:disulfide bond formation protein DsbB